MVGRQVAHAAPGVIGGAPPAVPALAQGRPRTAECARNVTIACGQLSRSDLRVDAEP